MKELFDQVSQQCSQMVTKCYSTSFSFGVRLLHASIRQHIYNIYGFVRFADEIVDTFHEYNKEELLLEFEKDYYKAFDRKISLNPILNAFQQTVHQFNIGWELVDAFLKSMKADLLQTKHNKDSYEEYIYGSADVVGLMCLKVFVKSDKALYEELKPYAMRLGSAFQKVNFLRDLKDDIHELNRQYFPILQNHVLDEASKAQIIQEIHEDFRIALIGIKKLPTEARLGVYTAYLYYQQLLRRIERTPAQKILDQRIRISNFRKVSLAISTSISYSLRLI